MTDRELDALVAEKVFGREVRWDKHGPMMRVPEEEEGWIAHATVPEFSRCVTSAFRVVDAMNRRGFYFEALHATPTQPWEIRFWPGPRAMQPMVKHASAPRAICLAALKTLGVDASSPAARKENE